MFVPQIPHTVSSIFSGFLGLSEGQETRYHAAGCRCRGVAKTGRPRLPDQGKPALAPGNAEISQSLAPPTKNSVGRPLAKVIVENVLVEIYWL
jgi:hypothetical protein